MLTIFAKHSTLDVWQGSEYASWQSLHIWTLHKYLCREGLMFLMFLDIIFMLFALYQWTLLNMYPTRQHTLYSYLTGWVKITNSLVAYISCNIPYLCDTLRDIKSFKTKTNLPIILKALTLPCQICLRTLKIISIF